MLRSNSKSLGTLLKNEDPSLHTRIKCIAEAPVLARCNHVDSNTTSVTVSWQPVTAGAFYTYSYDNGDIETTRRTSVTVTGLTVDTTYTFNVTVHVANATGNSVVCTATTCT